MRDKASEDADRRRYERVIERYLRDCYRTRTPVRASQIAEKLQANRQYISTTITRLFGKTLKAILLEKQLAYAAKLLEVTELSAAEIGAAAGFANRLVFGRAFVRVFGVSTVAYRKQSASRH